MADVKSLFRKKTKSATKAKAEPAKPYVRLSLRVCACMYGVVVPLLSWVSSDSARGTGP